MTKLSLINIIKYNPLIYKIYFNVGNLAIRILKLFIRHNDRRIFLFRSAEENLMTVRKQYTSDLLMIHDLTVTSLFGRFKIQINLLSQKE